MNLDVGQESELEMYSLGGTGVQAVRGKARGGPEAEKRGSAPCPGGVLPWVGGGEGATKL